MGKFNSKENDWKVETGIVCEKNETLRRHLGFTIMAFNR